MKRILGLSILASVALGLLSGCGAVQGKISPEAYRRGIQAKARHLAVDNQRFFGQSSFWSGGNIGPQDFQTYPDLWSAVTNHLIQYVTYNDLTAASYTDYVTRLTRLCLVYGRAWSPSQAVALSWGGLAQPEFGFMPVTYPGNPAFLQGSNANTWYATYLGGVFTGQ